MATHAITWAPGADVLFDDLDFVIRLGGELALTHSAAPSPPSINLSRLRLEGPSGNSRGVPSPKEASHNATLCLEGFVRSASIAFPFGLRNIYSQQNGVVERKNRTLITLARTMLDEYNTHEALWAEAINTACYASNRLFLQKFFGKIPYELLNGKKMDVSFF